METVLSRRVDLINLKSFTADARARWMSLIVALLLILSILLSLMVGAVSISGSELWSVWMHSVNDPRLELLYDFRWPRVQAAVFAGLALGVAGCLMQAVSRNKLATPDMLGVNEGAAFAILIGFLVSAVSLLAVSWWIGVLGSALTLAVILVVAKGVGWHGQRFILAGLGLSALLRAAIELMLSRQELSHASALYLWSMGYLSSRSYQLSPLIWGCAVLLPLALLSQRAIQLLRLDVQIASTLGLNVQRTQLWGLCLAMLLSGLAVGVCGPMAFVALAAPVMAGFMWGHGRISVFGSALLGACVVLWADTLGRLILPNQELPAGVVCHILGGVFVLWLLWRDR
ncbi:Hemin transport system permease protein HmuU [Ephemeroptericola cinctiostellae]|uniref:Hemin transport system permease protein HmuU n=1 Tax=Ephemeroptericola cinctiostellae TaxID=2268024 RepID=A0A345DB65_9BURK|nr:iron ABC transporter permease [Ephemeroptericola cinctiostellae]AXF85603.1 Hemin transport system permease protein HmuU [Ephemeroptericola cinctiostellae]